MSTATENTLFDRLLTAAMDIRKIDRSAGGKSNSVSEAEAEFEKAREVLTHLTSPENLANADSIGKMHEAATELKRAQVALEKKREAAGDADVKRKSLIAVIKELAEEL